MDTQKEVVVVEPSLADRLMSDIEVLGNDLVRSGEALVVCVSLNSTLMVRSFAVTVETANIGSRWLVEELPDTAQGVANVFTAMVSEATKIVDEADTKKLDKPTSD